ncbi:GNAT family N-acetyltransferase [Candidatus Entotheonella palauensis]|uniref:GNAT family N-acetyltransferase n=1 Tax=Candidatus Entotheonella palauensis TaxID=93172 RepID=UPI000B7FB135|nr:GNAT family N-acetyltransferase [Candidatus Entotheonella palauensis]
MELTIITGESARDTTEVLPLCLEVFEDFSPSYLSERLQRVTDPVLVCARLRSGRLAGFKLGYRRRPQLLYSWLGGVHPEARRQGLARKLMARQHDWASANGYRFIETQTQATNNAMLVLNLQSGFMICGYETNAQGVPVVIQRKALSVVENGN